MMPHDDQIKYLEEQIRYHDDLFWNLHDPAISDSAYDELVEALRDLDPDNPLCNRINTPAVAGAKIKHVRPMLSLAKCYTEAELLEWALSVARGAQEEFLVMKKYDGWSIEMPDDETAVTRGDGEEGDDVSHIVPDLFIRGTHDFELGPLYGEVVILKSTFRRAKEEGLIPYKNTRSALQGIITNRRASQAQLELLELVPFRSYIERATLDEFEGIDWMEVLRDFQDGDIPTDGAVIALADTEYAESLGSTEHHPRHSIALKHKNPEGTTKLLDVVWQCGKGRISPVAILEPVEVDGVTIKQSTLHNMDFIAQKNIQIGDTVVIGRMGQVIPGILRLAEPGKTRRPIVCEQCPACEAPAALKDQNYVCTNHTDCPGTLGKRLHDALVRLGVENIGPSTCGLLVADGFDTVFKVFRMTAQQWGWLRGFAEKSANQTHNHLALVRSAPIEDYRLLAAMNIPGVGITMSRKILDKFTLAELESGAELSTIDGVGPGVVRAIQDSGGFQSAEWKGLRQTFLNVVETKGLTSRPTVCFTGKAFDGRTRDAWAKDAEARGFVFAKSVTKALSVLVAEKLSTTKASKALKYGTRVITYEQFKELLDEKAQKI